MNNEALEVIAGQIEVQMSTIAKEYNMKIIDSRRGEGSQWIFRFSQAPTATSFYGGTQRPIHDASNPNAAMVSDLDALRNRLVNTIAPVTIRYENNAIAFVVDVSDMVNRASRLGRNLCDDLDKSVVQLNRIRQEEENDARLMDKQRKESSKLDKKLKKEKKSRSMKMEFVLMVAFIAIVYLSLKLIAQ